MYCKMLFAVVSLMLDTHPWYQLLGLCVPTLVILVLVLVDKPFRCPDGNHSGMTDGDWQMVLAQVLQLLSYAVATLCLMNQQGRQAEGEAGLSEGVELFSALVGLVIVIVQLTALVPSLWAHATSKSERDSSAEPEPREQQLDDKFMMAELGGVGGGQPVEATEVVECPVGDAERDDDT